MEIQLYYILRRLASIRRRATRATTSPASFVSLRVTCLRRRATCALKRGQASLACQRSCLITQLITLPLSAPEACTAFVCGLLDRLELYGSCRAPLIVFALVLITFHKFPILVMTTLVMNLLLSANAVGRRHPLCH
jgi:hypothetical protein